MGLMLRGGQLLHRSVVGGGAPRADRPSAGTSGTWSGTPSDALG